MSPVVVGVLAIVVYSINLDYTPLFDELVHRRAYFEAIQGEASESARFKER
jgi:hypothetical protein